MGVRGTSEASVPLLSASSDFDAMRLEDPFIATHLYVLSYYFIHYYNSCQFNLFVPSIMLQYRPSILHWSVRTVLCVCTVAHPM